MKTKTLVLAFAAVIFFLNNTILFSHNSSQVNSILGDKSFINAFGYLPDDNTDEVLRIKSHLEYVEQILRNKNTSGLSQQLIEKRNHLLNILNEYIEAGIFPGNYDYEGKRVPCFIDRDGRICAVGYLIEKTSDRETAGQINSRHKYALIIEMNDEVVDKWIESSGLTKEECAMIQPEYGYKNGNGISTSDIVISTTFTAANLTINTLNAMKISNGGISYAMPIVGLVTGTAQIIFGAVTYPGENYDSYFYTDNVANDGEKILSAVNIGIGASTVILSVISLINDEEPKTKKTSWNIYGFPAKGDVGVGFSLSHKF